MKSSPVNALLLAIASPGTTGAPGAHHTPTHTVSMSDLVGVDVPAILGPIHHGTGNTWIRRDKRRSYRTTRREAITRRNARIFRRGAK